MEDSPASSLPEAGPPLAAAMRESGSLLPVAERDFFEPRLGHDLADVRVHTGKPATLAVRELQAQAFAYGRDVYFDSAHWSPGTESGRRLLGHELVHVVQQAGSSGVEHSTGDQPIQRVARPTIQREFCEDPDEIAVGGLPQLLEAHGVGEPEIPQILAERVSFEEFESATGMRGDDLPEDTFVGMDRIQEGGLTYGPELPADVDAGLGPAGALAAMGLTPQVPIHLAPANSVGILVTRPHLSVFAKVDGKLTIVGFRGNLATHLASQLPGEPGLWFKQKLIDGVSGKMRGDRFFTLLGDQSIIFRETEAGTSRRFSSYLQSVQYGGDYRFTPPDPAASPGSTEGKLAERTYRARGETQVTMKGTRNCITVPVREIHWILGTSPTAGGVDLTTGRTASGEHRPHQHGRARLMSDYARNPDLSKARPDVRSATITPRAATAVGVIRVGGGVMFVYGGYQTGKRLSEAWGTDDFPLVAAQEAMSWGGGILGTAAGAAGTSALICAPTGPVTLACAVGGFLGGLFVGTVGAVVGSMVIPVMIRTIEGTTQAIVLLAEGFATAAEIAGGISGAFGDMIFTNLLRVRNSLNPCNWELQGLSTRHQVDVLALGFHLWREYGSVDVDTFLGMAGRPVKSFGVPDELLEHVASGMSQAVQARTGVEFVFTPEYVGGINAPELVRQLEGYGLLEFKYDPELLAEIQMLPEG